MIKKHLMTESSIMEGNQILVIIGNQNSYEAEQVLLKILLNTRDFPSKDIKFIKQNKNHPLVFLLLLLYN